MYLIYLIYLIYLSYLIRRVQCSDWPTSKHTPLAGAVVNQTEKKCSRPSCLQSSLLDLPRHVVLQPSRRPRLLPQ